VAETRQQGVALMTAICLLIGTLLVIQLWLVAAALDAFLSGEGSVLVPAGLASLALFLACGGLLLYAEGFDRRQKRVTE
jgi:hypothetical protein